MGFDVWDDPKPAPGSLGLVQDFVNTRNYFHGGDLLGDTDEATIRLVEIGLLEDGERLREAERRRLVEFREGFRGLLLAHNGMVQPGPDAETLNELSASCTLGVRFRPDGHPALEATAEDGPAERV